MSEQELIKFIEKVETLKRMVDSLEKIPERRNQLASCSTHEEVIKLAKDWGFQIGRRWGEKI